MSPPMKNKQIEWLKKYHRRILMGIFLLAFVVRGIAFVQYSASPLVAFQNWNQSDMHFFAAWADSIVAGDVWTNQSMRPYHNWHEEIAQTAFDKHPQLTADIVGALPENSTESERNQYFWEVLLEGKRLYQDALYPYLIAGSFGLFGRNIAWVQIGQLLLGLLILYLIYGISRQLFDETTALIAVLIAALYPTLVVYELVLLRDILNTFLALLLVFILAKAVESQQSKHWLFWGILQGIALLNKAVFLLFLAWALLMLLVLYWRKWTVLAKNTGLVLVGVWIGLLPLMIRNWVVGVPPLSFASLGGLAYCFSNAVGYEIYSIGNIKTATLPLLQSQRNSLASIGATIATHDSLWSFVTLQVQKFLGIWTWYESPNNINFYYFREKLPLLQYLPINFAWIGALGLVGVALTARTHFFKKIHPLFGLVLMQVVLLTAFFIHARLRLPLVVALIPFAAYTIHYLFRNWRNWRGKYSMVLAVTLLLLVWMHRSLPDDRNLIRVEDYAVTWDGHYRPIVHQALLDKDISLAKTTVERFIAEAPDFVAQIKANQQAQTFFEEEIAWLYSGVYAIYGRLWGEMGRTDLQQQYLDKAKLLQAFGGE